MLILLYGTSKLVGEKHVVNLTALTGNSRRFIGPYCPHVCMKVFIHPMSLQYKQGGNGPISWRATEAGCIIWFDCSYYLLNSFYLKILDSQFSRIDPALSDATYTTESSLIGPEISRVSK